MKLGLLAAGFALAVGARASDLSDLRGAMISTYPSVEDLLALRGFGANHARWQLTWEGFPRGRADRSTLAEYDQWLEGALQHLDAMLPVLERSGLQVVLDLHSPPGGRDDFYDCRLFQDPAAARRFVSIWEELARRYRGKKAIVAFDLLNEPSEGRIAPGLESWPELALRASRAIRAIDPARTIVYEPAPWAGAAAFQDLRPLPLKNVVYSFHFYDPMEFTHQGVFDRPKGPGYPGEVAGKRWDAARIEASVQPVLEFQRRYRVPIYVGEFSAVRWAVGGERWVEDAANLWNARGWGWAYHAFREWEGWSPEASPERLALMKKLWTKRRDR